MAYNEDFRALASVVISKDIDDKELKDKALATMKKIVTLMDMGVGIEISQTSEFLNNLAAKSAKIEVIKQ